MEEFEQEIEFLNISELAQLHKNLEMGDAHLQKLLTPQELEELLSFADVKQIEALTTDQPELIGNIVLMINPVITGAFGAWLGISGLMNLKLNPYVFFSLICFAFSICWTVGFISLLTTKKESQESINRIKESKLEITTLDKIRKKKLKELEDSFNFIKNKTLELSKRLNIPNIDSTDSWFRLFHNLASELTEKKEHLKHPLLLQLIKKIEEPQKKKLLRSFLQKLASTEAKEPIKRESWMVTHLSRVISAAFPTLIGSFGSMFVYFGGALNISRELGPTHIFRLFSHPQIKLASIVAAICITLYFFISFLYSSRKSYLRSKELELNREAIIKKESELTELDKKLHQAKKEKQHVNEVMNLLTVLDTK